MCGIIGTLLGGMLGQGKSAEAPKTMTAPAISSGTESLEADKAAKQKAATAQGYQSTIATSSSGDTSTATTNKKTLLGG